MSLDDKLIINAALTGCVLSKEDHPELPIHVDEIVADARRVTDAGASILHLHARDEQGNPTHDSSVYKRLIEELRGVCPGTILCVSLSGRFKNDPEGRAMPLAARYYPWAPFLRNPGGVGLFQ